mmetsp:Transcript_56942/g.105295  ORF Transcript_56942/g.105295 Transcript_56942/m.105295 type:complete len:102 (+) Transcript_56942:45-350(+)
MHPRGDLSTFQTPCSQFHHHQAVLQFMLNAAVRHRFEVYAGYRCYLHMNPMVICFMSQELLFPFRLLAMMSSMLAPSSPAAPPGFSTSGNLTLDRMPMTCS